MTYIFLFIDQIGLIRGLVPEVWYGTNRKPNASGKIPRFFTGTILLILKIIYLQFVLFGN